MVGSSVDGAEAVEACRDALGDSCGHDSVTVSSTINTLELSNQSGGVDKVAFCETHEFEGQGVKRLGDIECRKLLDYNVSVSNDDALSIDLLRSSIVVADRQYVRS